MISWQNLFSFPWVHKEKHEQRDLTMPLNHPTQLCQDKFTIKDEELKEQYPVTAHALNFDFRTGCCEITGCEKSKRTLKNPFASRLAEFDTTLNLFRITDQWYIVPVKRSECSWLRSMWPGSFITLCEFCSQRSIAFVRPWLNINKETSYNHTTLEEDTLTRLPKQILWENVSGQKFKDALRSPRTGDTFSENTELSLEKVENILITTTKCCLKTRAGKTRKRIKSLSNKKCFGKECRLKRHELRKLASKKHQDPLNTIIREQYRDTLASLRNYLVLKRMTITMPRFLS